MRFLHCLIHEIKELTGLAFYFAINFALVALIVKLFLQEYSIELYILPKILVASFFAAKTVLVVDHMRVVHFLRNKKHYIAVLYKTFLYSFMAVLLGILEKLVEAYLKTKNILLAFTNGIHEIHFHHFFAVILMLVMIFLVYNIFDELDRYLGKGSLRRFFFGRPT